MPQTESEKVPRTGRLISSSFFIRFSPVFGQFARLQAIFRNTSSCYVFKQGNNTIQTSTDSVNRIAVKIPNDPTVCPKQPSALFTQLFTETLNGSQIIRSEFSYSNSQYRVVYTVSICPDTTDLYTRIVGKTTYQVCVGFRTFPGGSGTYYDARKLCKENGGYGLTGPLDGNEYAILRDHGLALRKQSVQDGTAFFWIDGFCPTFDVFDFDDESHNGVTSYQFQKGDPSVPPPAALFMLGANGGDLIGDSPENVTELSGYPFMGALCRVNDVLLRD
ncbi:hypothetical protein B9Z55_004232 [Caenorhabditis nigoni]|uniref:C-type lectin domain-containing protein n=1 Tax=Caenorhabditis nigoni TaxID=1611254 RepID=A0A2G5UVE8_9PELO|nr:hypothetical protein B9Z55_004232 [Caenorhabditis nigoni]